MSTVSPPVRPTDRQPARPTFSPPSWRNPRFLIGAALLLGATIIGALLLQAPKTTPLWVARHDLPAGAVLRASDLNVVAANTVGPYTPASRPVAGQRINRGISAGEFIPTAALGSTLVGDMRSVAVPIEDQHSPPSLIAGNYVDVWVTPRSIGGTLGIPTLLLASVPVSSISRDSMGGATGPATVVLDVKPSQAESLISGLRRGVIDLVRVPGTHS